MCDGGGGDGGEGDLKEGALRDAANYYFGTFASSCIHSCNQFPFLFFENTKFMYRELRRDYIDLA